jgi:hypothetical protein
MNKEDVTVSRREFAKAAALTTAAALAPIDLLAQQQSPKETTQAKPPAKPPETEAIKLSEVSRAEADFAYQTLMRKYGGRFNEEQKKDIKRLIYAQQEGLDKLRAFAVTNGDQPATVFKLAMPEAK